MKNHTLSKVISLSILVAILILALALPANAGIAGGIDRYMSNIPKDEMEDIFSLNVSDIPNAFEWITQTDTFVVLEKYNGGICFWWNTPNIQQSLYNMLYNQITISGYGENTGIDVREGKHLIPLPLSAKTALQKYGFKIPYPTYVGERPLITISILGVLCPDSIYDGIGRVWDFIWSGNIISYPSDSDLDSLMYVYPRDYDIQGGTFYSWVRENWYTAIANIDPGQILLGIADEDGKKDGKVWVANNIIFESGLAEPGLSADDICSELEILCGKYYGQVAQGIIVCSGIDSVHHNERIMPYELETLIPEDKTIFNGVSDPRSDMQQTAMQTGYDRVIFNYLSGKILDLSGSLSEMTVALNGITNFEWVENQGIDLQLLWRSEITKLFLTILGVIFLFFAVKSAFMIIREREGMFKILLKVLSFAILVGVIVAASLNPNLVYNSTKQICSSIFNLGNYAFEHADAVVELYGTGDSAQKEDVNLWLPYFNLWTVYQTNHSITDREQRISSSSGPELERLKYPKISTVQQNLWSTVLADALTDNGKPLDGNVYRMVDHFMAPRVEVDTDPSASWDDIWSSLDITQNENYNGFIQSTIQYGTIPMQIVILLLVVIKVLFFIELLFDLIFLLVKLALTTMQKNQFMMPVKQIFAMAVNVAVVNMGITLCIWTSLVISAQLPLVIFSFFYAFLAFNALKRLASTSGAFCPRFIKNGTTFFNRHVRRFVGKLAAGSAGFALARKHSAKRDESNEANSGDSTHYGEDDEEANVDNEADEPSVGGESDA